MIPPRVAALAVGLACSTATLLPAQRFGLTAAAGYFTLSGEDFEGIEAGRGFQGSAWYSVNRKFQLGAGVVRSSHDIAIVDENIIDLFLFAESRLVFATPGVRFSPFVGARIGWAKQSIEIQGVSGGASGLGLGAIGGLSVNVGHTADLEFATTFTHFALGEISVDGQYFPDTESSGNVVGLQLGISFWFGAQ